MSRIERFAGKPAISPEPLRRGRAWLLKTKTFIYERAADCDRQTSMTGGTIMHASKLPLTMWFWAAFSMATYSNGISAL